MPWDDDQPLALRRADFIQSVDAGGRPFAQVCADFGISRKTGYKWLDRARQPRPQPLRDRSRRPLRSPRKSPAAVERAILDAHDAHPWGARKLHAFLCRNKEAPPAPCRSTVHAILQRGGRVRASGPPVPPQRFERREPNHLWQVDFKGPLPRCPRTRCLLSVEDDHSRYLLAVRLCPDMTMATVWGLLRELFGEAGLPLAILSDNGFAPRGPGSRGLSWLGTRLCRLGILSPHGMEGEPVRVEEKDGEVGIWYGRRRLRLVPVDSLV